MQQRVASLENTSIHTRPLRLKQALRKYNRKNASETRSWPKRVCYLKEKGLTWSTTPFQHTILAHFSVFSQFFWNIFRCIWLHFWICWWYFWSVYAKLDTVIKIESWLVWSLAGLFFLFQTLRIIQKILGRPATARSCQQYLESLLQISVLYCVYIRSDFVDRSVIQNCTP